MKSADPAEGIKSITTTRIVMYNPIISAPAFDYFGHLLNSLLSFTFPLQGSSSPLTPALSRKGHKH
jgi:hypothetical protein